MDVLACAFSGHDHPEPMEIDDQPGPAFAVFCLECGKHGPVDADKHAAIDKWDKPAEVPS